MMRPHPCGRMNPLRIHADALMPTRARATDRRSNRPTEEKLVTREIDRVLGQRACARRAADMIHPLVVGLDLSLTSTGIARWTPTALWLGTLTSDKKGLMRLRQIRTQVVANTRGADLVVIEALPPANRFATTMGVNERAALFYMVLDRLHDLGLRYAVVQPVQLKGYALGKGGGDGVTKTAVVSAVVRRYFAEPKNDDEADACVLAAMGRHFLGMPPARVPETHSKWLKAVQWPEGKAFSEVEDGGDDDYPRYYQQH